MRRITKNGWRLLGASLVLWGCASQSTAGDATPPAEADAAPCPIAMPSSGGIGWRAVKADEFSFCVPADWRQRGALTWRGPGGSISWTRTPTGMEEGKRVGYAVATTSGAPPMASSGPAPQTTNALETIGGLPVDVRTTSFESKFTATANWRSPVLQFVGASTDRTGVDRYIEIFRTVRFGSSPQ